MVSRPVNTLARLKQELPSHCTSRHVVRVRFGETDLMGIVHHATYISYFEVGRVEYMRRRGLDYHSWTELGIHLPVVEAHIRYRKSARFDELLCIETRLTELGKERAELDPIVSAYRDYRANEQAIDETRLMAEDDDREMAAMAESISVKVPVTMLTVAASSMVFWI